MEKLNRKMKNVKQYKWAFKEWRFFCIATLKIRQHRRKIQTKVYKGKSRTKKHVSDSWKKIMLSSEYVNEWTQERRGIFQIWLNINLADPRKTYPCSNLENRRWESTQSNQRLKEALFVEEQWKNAVYFFNQIQCKWDSNFYVPKRKKIAWKSNLIGYIF